MKSKGILVLLVSLLTLAFLGAGVLAGDQDFGEKQFNASGHQLYYWHNGPEKKGDYPDKATLLNRNSGLEIETENRVVYSRDGMWRYQLSFSALDEKIELTELEMKVYTYRGNYVVADKFGPDNFQKWWGKTALQPNETVRFGAGFPSKNDLYFVDYLLHGKDKSGEEKLGSIRFYFSKRKRPKIEEVAGNQKLEVKTNKKTVQPDDKGGYHYRISFSADKEVKLKRLEIYYGLPQGGYGFDRAFGPKKLKEFLGSTELQENKKLGMRTGFNPSDELSIKFRDYIAFGITESGKEVQGAVRVFFEK